MHKLDRHTAIESLAYTIFDRDDWQVIDTIDTFLTVYDGMPPKMKVVVDLKLSQKSNKEIAAIMNISLSAVYCLLHRSKKRIIQSLSYSLGDGEA